VWRHGIGAALIPLASWRPAAIAGLFGAAVATETVFGIPGAGRLAFEAAAHGQDAVIQAVVVLAAVLVLVLTTMSEIGRAVLDPQGGAR
jgi:peptide/nickel transport system permease protein